MPRLTLRDRFNKAAQTLLSAQDLSPRNQAVEKAVFDFIDLAINHPKAVRQNSKNMPGPTLSRLKNAFLVADREMEKYWAEKILEKSANKTSLQWDDFDIYPWFKDYPDLYQFEKRALEKAAGPITKDTVITYIGSGALPVIPLMLHQETGCQIECIEINPGAVALSRRIVSGMGMDQKIRTHLGDGKSLPVQEKTDILFLANAPLSDAGALQKIVRDLQPKTIFARSSTGGTAILYPSMTGDSFRGAGYSLAHLAKDHKHQTHTGLIFHPTPGGKG